MTARYIRVTPNSRLQVHLGAVSKSEAKRLRRLARVSRSAATRSASTLNAMGGVDTSAAILARKRARRERLAAELAASEPAELTDTAVELMRAAINKTEETR